MWISLFRNHVDSQKQWRLKFLYRPGLVPSSSTHQFGRVWSFPHQRQCTFPILQVTVKRNWNSIIYTSFHYDKRLCQPQRLTLLFFTTWVEIFSMTYNSGEISGLWELFILFVRKLTLSKVCFVSQNIIFIKEAMQTCRVGKEVSTTEYYPFSVLTRNIIVHQDSGIGKTLNQHL